MTWILLVYAKHKVTQVCNVCQSKVELNTVDFYQSPILFKLMQTKISP